MRTAREQTLYVEAPWACFTRPEFKAERVSYDVITPAAARGLFEAIYWKPQFRWEIRRIEVLRRGRLVPMGARSESARMAPPVATVTRRLRQGRIPAPIDPAADRVLRSMLALREVAYRITARAVLSEAALAQGESPAKHFEIFARRAASGQCFHQPYMGLREMAVRRFELLGESADPLVTAEPQAWSEELGPMFFDFDYRGEQPLPLVYFPRIADGVIQVPKLSQVAP